MLNNMEAEEILPGKFRFFIKGIKDQAYSWGARALTASITGAYSDEEVAKRIANILKLGMLSTENRFKMDMGVSGLSSYSDFYTGGADSVFTQMIFKQDIDDKTELDDFYYFGKARLIFSLDPLESCSYQYFYDYYGIRKGDAYRKRPGLLDFITSPLHKQYYFPGNEVMIKDRIDPKYITAIVVRTEEEKFQLIGNLSKYGLVDNQGNILGKPAHQFIKVCHLAADAVA
jgi:hypothetical protein